VKCNNPQENHQLTLKLNHSHCNHLIVVKTWRLSKVSYLHLWRKMFKNPFTYPHFGVKKMGRHQNHSWVTKILNGNNSMSTHASAIHLKALAEEIVVSKYLHCLFCFVWINVPQTFCIRFQCSNTLSLSVPHAPHFLLNLHNHNSPADWVREMFKSYKDAGSLVVYIFF